MALSAVSCSGEREIGDESRSWIKAWVTKWLRWLFLHLAVVSCDGTIHDNNSKCTTASFQEFKQPIGDLEQKGR